MTARTRGAKVGEALMGAGRFAQGIAETAIPAGVGAALGGPLGMIAMGSILPAALEAGRVPQPEKGAAFGRTALLNAALLGTASAAPKLLGSMLPAAAPEAATVANVAGLTAAGLTPAAMERRPPEPTELAMALAGGAIGGLVHIPPPALAADVAAVSAAEGALGVKGARGLVQQHGVRAVEGAMDAAEASGQIVDPAAVERARDAIRTASDAEVAKPMQLTLDLLRLQPIEVPPQAAVSGEAGAAGLGPATLGLATFAEKDVLPAARTAASAVGEIYRGLRGKLAPTIGVPTDVMDKLMSEIGERRKAATLLDFAMEKAEPYMASLPEDKQIEFADRVKTGQKQATPELQAIADAIAPIDKASWKEFNKFSPLTWKENHLRTIWKVIPGSEQPGRLAGLFGRRPFAGTGGFLRQATLPDMSTGIAMGGIPVTYNPVTMFKLAQADMMKYLTAHRMWDWAKNHKYVEFVPRGKNITAGFAKVEDSLAKVMFKAKSGEGMIEPGEYYAEENFARVLNNHLSNNRIGQTITGRGLMSAKNAYTGVELSFSGFHPAFITGEALTSRMATAMRRIWNLGVAGKNPAQAIEGLKDLAKSPYAPRELYKTGTQTTEYFKDPAAFSVTVGGQKFLKNFPQVKRYIDLLYAGGGDVRANSAYRLNTISTFKQAIKDGNVLGALIRTPLAGSEFVMKPVFDYYIPRLKVGLFMREMPLRLKERAAEIKAGTLSEFTVARDVLRFVEHRFGEMSWESLFWNNTMKGAAQVLFRSMTWKMGSILGFLEAPFEQAAEIRRAYKAGRVPHIEPRMAWAASVAGLTAVLGTTISKTMSGRYPWEWEDGRTMAGQMRNMAFPHSSDTDPDQRMSLPTYMKDIIHISRSPKEYVRSSLSGPAMKLWEDMSNRDFYNTEIRHPGDPIQNQALGLMLHMMPSPFAVTSAFRLREQGASDAAQLLSFMGFLKAPKWAGMTPFEQVLAEETSAQFPAKTRTKEEFALAQEKRHMIQSVRTGKSSSQDIAAFAAEKGLGGRVLANMLARSREDPRLAAFKGLGYQAALKAYIQGDEEERNLTRQVLKEKLLRAMADNPALRESLLPQVQALGVGQ